MKNSTRLISAQGTDELILLIRGHRVMLDRDLAALYGVATGNLNKAVARNRGRFPADFMFRLSAMETESLIFQSGRSNKRGGTRHFPHAFTQEGIAMLSSVLHSKRALQVNIAIMRAFVKLRGILGANVELARKFDELESRVGGHDKKIAGVIEAMRQLALPPYPEDDASREIGFHIKEESTPYRVGRNTSKSRKKNV